MRPRADALTVVRPVINTYPMGWLKDLRLSAEWLEPVMDDPNSYQLEREGTLWANATMSF